MVWEDIEGNLLYIDREGNLYEVNERNQEHCILYRPVREYTGQIGNVQGGWSETKKYKDKNGDWVTRKAWGSGKAGW